MTSHGLPVLPQGQSRSPFLEGRPACLGPRTEILCPPCRVLLKLGPLCHPTVHTALTVMFLMGSIPGYNWEAGT